MTRKRERERQPDGKLTDEERQFIKDNLRLAGVVATRKSKVAKVKPPKRRRSRVIELPDPSVLTAIATVYLALGFILRQRGHPTFGVFLSALSAVMFAASAYQQWRRKPSKPNRKRKRGDSS